MSARAFEGYALGATLYMPVIHPHVAGIVAGRRPCPAPSIVLCLEDALAETDVARGLVALRGLLEGPVAGPLTFVRPRSLEMARRLSEMPGMGRLAGMVAPKVTPEDAPAWMALAEGADLQIMPTLEHAGYHDPARVAALRDALLGHDTARIAAIRIGGNDLLSALALRRRAGVTSWEGPLAWVLSMASSMLGAAGFPLAAPVFDVIHDMQTLAREARADVAAGFVSKTAIHPAQVPCILDAFRPGADEVAQARAILDGDARAVFQIGGVMCEPATHRAWAARTLARAAAFGAGAESRRFPGGSTNSPGGTLDGG